MLLMRVPGAGSGADTAGLVREWEFIVVCVYNSRNRHADIRPLTFSTDSGGLKRKRNVSVIKKTFDSYIPLIKIQPVPAAVNKNKDRGAAAFK